MLKIRKPSLSSAFFFTRTQSFCSAAVPDLSNTAHCLFLDGLAFSDVCLVRLKNPAQGEWNGVHQVVPRLSKVRFCLSAGMKQVLARSFHSPFVCATLTAHITSEVFYETSDHLRTRHGTRRADRATCRMQTVRGARRLPRRAHHLPAEQ